MWLCLWWKITKAKKLVHQREKTTEWFFQPRILQSRCEHIVLCTWEKTLSWCNQFTPKSGINYASSWWCLCTIDTSQILSDSDLIFWWAHQQSEITALTTRGCPTSAASNTVSLFGAPWHPAQFSNQSPIACAKIKPTHIKLHRLSQSTWQDCKHCTMAAVIWEDCSGQGMCKQSLSEECAAQTLVIVDGDLITSSNI